MARYQLFSEDSETPLVDAIRGRVLLTLALGAAALLLFDLLAGLVGVELVEFGGRTLGGISRWVPLVSASGREP
ncbi:hypothetical protein ACFQQG_08740 [Halovenus salina]|uniref:Uncharacterized protein n=1 Tax=Halovenus salina TaxID=1510225 RepID=A0ABD5W242_9EURY